MDEMEAGFTGWIQAELDRRGWEQADLARNGGLTPQQVSRVMQGTRGYGLDFIRGIARGFRVPVEAVMRKAGWLPPAGEVLPELRAWNERLLFLSDDDRAAAIADMDALLRTIEKWARPGSGTRGRRGE
jgi:transcriptional regulator with XRE-family HTH domain